MFHVEKRALKAGSGLGTRLTVSSCDTCLVCMFNLIVIIQQVSSRRESGATMGMPSNFSSRTPGNYALDIEEMCLVEQAAKRVNELGSFWECKRGIDKEEDENDEDFDLSLHTLLSFGRQISLGMVRPIITSGILMV